MCLVTRYHHPADWNWLKYLELWEGGTPILIMILFVQYCPVLLLGGTPIFQRWCFCPVLKVLGGHFNDAAIAHREDIRETTWGGWPFARAGNNWSEFKLSGRQQTMLAVHMWSYFLQAMKYLFVRSSKVNDDLALAKRAAPSLSDRWKSNCHWKPISQLP